jgi:hypothetical protein
MDELAPQSDDEAVREAQEVRAIRARRDAALSPEERLERVHELCRQLAAIERVSPPEDWMVPDLAGLFRTLTENELRFVTIGDARLLRKPERGIDAGVRAASTGAGISP